MGLILCIYTLRHVQDEFSINFELKFISFIWIIFGFFQFMIMIFFPDSPIITTNSLNYFMVVRGLLSLLVTAVIPIKKSYNPNSIIPFPINEECIKSLEMALLMPTSANYFYDYLENSCENKDALIYFGLYADIRTFLRLIEDGESDFVLRSQAEQIFQDYIGEDKQWDIEIPDEIHIELSRYFENGQAIGQVDETLFSNLYVFTLDILDMYYKDFQKSKRFEELKDEVSKQEILYEILRRYSMISN